MITYPHPITIQWVSRAPNAVLDRYNTPGTTETTVDIPGCVVWPRTTAETLTSATAETDNMITDAITAKIPHQHAIGPQDVVIVRGVEYEVEGRPRITTNPWTAEIVQVINAVRVTG